VRRATATVEPQQRVGLAEGSRKGPGEKLSEEAVRALPSGSTSATKLLHPVDCSETVLELAGCLPITIISVAPTQEPTPLERASHQHRDPDPGRVRPPPQCGQ